MSEPQMVQSALGDEDVVARVALGGEDELYATPTRTLVYRSEGLLSDETVEEYPHGAERITVSEGRRKAKITLDYGLDGEQTFGLSVKHLDRALHPVVEGVLKANDILDDDEPVERLFRFSELTLVVTGGRVVKHIGSSVWDEDFEEYRYGDVTDLQFEGGSVATSVVMTVDGRQERFKAPNDDARELRETLESALLSYWGVASLAELREANEPEEEEADPSSEDGEVSFGDGPDPLSANPAELSEEPSNATRSSEESPVTTEAVEATGGQGDVGGSQQVETPARAVETGATEAEAASNGVDDGFEGSGFQSAAADADERVAEELAELRATVDRQGEEIRRQGELIEQLIEELRRGR